MSPQDRQEFDNMKRELQEMREWRERVTFQQLKIPIDEGTLSALDQSLYGFKLKRITVGELRYDTLTDMTP